MDIFKKKHDNCLRGEKKQWVKTAFCELSIEEAKITVLYQFWGVDFENVVYSVQKHIKRVHFVPQGLVTIA